MMLKGKFQGERDRDKDYVTNSDNDKGLQDLWAVEKTTGQSQWRGHNDKKKSSEKETLAMKRKHWQ